ncbi:DUF433 domain-containing protein [candidate division KSB1 bacterium]|nr:DUF433 domain-containing protein [candidate division KSB1 bacterium]
MSLKEEVISSSPEIVGGTPALAGTRGFVQTIFDYMEAGESVDDF